MSSDLHAQAEPLYIFLADAFSFFSAASRAASAVVSLDLLKRQVTYQLLRPLAAWRQLLVVVGLPVVEPYLSWPRMSCLYRQYLT